MAEAAPAPETLVPEPIPPAAAADTPASPENAEELLQKKYGFSRPEIYSEELPGTVHHYERHIFLAYKDSRSWPSVPETSDDDPLPRSLASSLKTRKADIPQKTRLTIYEESESDGEVLIFPDMIKYKGLGVSNIDGFVEDVLVNQKEWSAGTPEKLEGSYIFVCAHTNRDLRCGTCGPILIETFQKEISKQSLEKSIFVKACSHVGGHKYAGNIIIYSQDASGQIVGHWYGYVTPDDVPALLNEHIGKGKIIEKLWRGQMGVTEPDQKLAHQERLQIISQTIVEDKNNGGCTKANGDSSGTFTCCQDTNNNTKNKETKETDGKYSRLWNQAFDSWGKGDTIAAVAVGAAIVAVVLVFKLSRRSAR